MNCSVYSTKYLKNLRINLFISPFQGFMGAFKKPNTQITTTEGKPSLPLASTSLHVTEDTSFVIYWDTALCKIEPKDKPQTVVAARLLQQHTWAIFGNVCVDKTTCTWRGGCMEGAQQALSGFTVYSDHINWIIAHYLLCSLEPKANVFTFKVKWRTEDKSAPLWLFPPPSPIPALVFSFPNWEAMPGP